MTDAAIPIATTPIATIPIATGPRSNDTADVSRADSPPVPFIDLDETTPTSLVELLQRHSCVVLNEGHHVDDALWRQMVSVSAAFFDLDEEAKEPVRWNGDGAWLGWLPVGSTDPVDSPTPKLVEKFELHLPNPWDGDVTDPAGFAERRAQFTYWPDRPEGFAETWLLMHQTLGALANRIMAMIVDALDLPSDRLDAWTTNHFANLVVNDYGAQVAAPVDGQTRTPGHVDIGGITLLSADEAPGGLEIDVDGEWVPVVLPPNSYLIQAGDLLRRWTNDLIPGNLHRVVNPPPEFAATSRRLSIAYFHYPAEDTLVEPAPSCIRADSPVGRPLESREHMMFRQRREQHEGVSHGDDV